MERKPFSEEEKKKLEDNGFTLIDEYVAHIQMSGKVHELSGATKDAVVIHSQSKIAALGSQYETYPVYLETLEITDYMNLADSFERSHESYLPSFDKSLEHAVNIAKEHILQNQEEKAEDDE